MEHGHGNCLADGGRLRCDRQGRIPQEDIDGKPQPGIVATLETHQWYVHLSRTEGADLGVIKAALADLRRACAPEGEVAVVNLGIFFGPTLLAELQYFRSLSLEDQENLFGRRKADSQRLEVQVLTSHLSHVELREGETADGTKPKRGEMVRRSTPYAMPDGTVGL